MNLAKCEKCRGKGILHEYLGISGGKCFACNGSGKIDQDKIQTKYGIAARLLENGEMISPLFWVKAKNPEAAIKKAKATLQKGNAMDPDTAEVIGTDKEYAASLN